MSLFKRTSWRFVSSSEALYHCALGCVFRRQLSHFFPGPGSLGSRFEQLKMEVRKGSMVNVNPTNTRPPNDTPEIRKYKKRFNAEILCAALWGENRFNNQERLYLLNMF